MTFQEYENENAMDHAPAKATGPSADEVFGAASKDFLDNRDKSRERGAATPGSSDDNRSRASQNEEAARKRAERTRWRSGSGLKTRLTPSFARWPMSTRKRRQA